MQDCCYWVGAEQPQRAHPEGAPTALDASTTPPRERSPAGEEPPAGGDPPARDAADDPPAMVGASVAPVAGNFPLRRRASLGLFLLRLIRLIFLLSFFQTSPPRTRWRSRWLSRRARMATPTTLPPPGEWTAPMPPHAAGRPRPPRPAQPRRARRSTIAPMVPGWRGRLAPRQQVTRQPPPRRTPGLLRRAPT